jgi:hypothetical protein
MVRLHLLVVVILVANIARLRYPIHSAVQFLSAVKRDGPAG